MTSIEQSKEKLKKNGYTWFELSEFDPEFYNWLQPLKCNEEINLKDKITNPSNVIKTIKAINVIIINTNNCFVLVTFNSIFSFK